MSTNLYPFPEQLKQACKLTGARWAVWVARYGLGWEFLCHFGLVKPRQAALAAALRLPETSAWLAGALNSGRTRSRSPGDLAETLGCRRIFAFASPGSPEGTLVGAGDLGKAEQSLFHILALAPPSRAVSAAISSAYLASISLRAASRFRL